MITVRVPLRISLFGGSTDYKEFYEKNGSFLIGTTINKFIHLSLRLFPSILSNNKTSRFTYSKIETVNSFDEIQNPLIRETLKFKKIKDPLELISFIDIPSRTGLGGSSSYCVGLLHLINRIYNILEDKKTIAKNAIHIEREILKESGGIQDQIWASYGGFNSIEICKDGNFFVKPMPITVEFKKELEKSILLIYTNDQRNDDDISKSHENKNKLNILKLAKESYTFFKKEDIKSIGNLLYETWLEKSKISNLITNNKIDLIIKDVIKLGSYGAKLLGSGGCGFILVICNAKVKKLLKEKYKDYILDIEFESDGVHEVYRSDK